MGDLDRALREEGERRRADDERRRADEERKRADDEVRARANRAEEERREKIRREVISQIEPAAREFARRAKNAGLKTDLTVWRGDPRTVTRGIFRKRIRTYYPQGESRGWRIRVGEYSYTSTSSSDADPYGHTHTSTSTGWFGFTIDVDGKCHFPHDKYVADLTYVPAAFKAMARYLLDGGVDPL